MADKKSGTNKWFQRTILSRRVEGGGEVTSRTSLERLNADAEQMVNQMENNGTGRDGVVSRGRLRMNGTEYWIGMSMPAN